MNHRQILYRLRKAMPKEKRHRADCYYVTLGHYCNCVGWGNMK